MMLENPKPPKNRAWAEDLFEQQWRQRMLPPVMREFPFAKETGRFWRFDFATVLAKPDARFFRLAVEIDGLVMRKDSGGHWQAGGRHATVQGIKEDNIKLATAVLLGWTVIRFDTSQVEKGLAIDFAVRILARHGWRAP